MHPTGPLVVLLAHVCFLPHISICNNVIHLFKARFSLVDC